MGPFLGFLTVAFILLSMTRKGVKIFLGKALARNKAKGLKMTTDVKILLLIQKYHRYFGIAALLTAIAHAAVQFSSTGLPSLTGATLVTLLILQGVSGYMVENKKGNQKIANLVHLILPPLMLALIIAHIILNSVYIEGLNIGG
jgi:predicted ferric reductase